MATLLRPYHARPNPLSGVWRTAVAAGVLAVLGGCVPGGSATLSWQTPTTNVDGSPLVGLAGYTIYFGDDPHLMQHAVRVADPQATRYVLRGLDPGMTYFRIVAYTESGQQSAMSAPVSKEIPP